MSTIKVENLTGITSGANANKIIVPSGQTLDASAATLVPSAGAVIQFVHTSGSYNKGFVSDTTYSSTGYTDISGATINITPNFSNSKIYITAVNHIYTTEESTDAWRGANIRIVRTVSGTDTDVLDDETGYGEATYMTNNSERWMTYANRHCIDTPNTTTAVTYRVQVASKYGNNLLINRNSYGAGGHLIAMEIKV